MRCAQSFCHDGNVGFRIADAMSFVKNCVMPATQIDENLTCVARYEDTISLAIEEIEQLVGYHMMLQE